MNSTFKLTAVITSIEGEDKTTVDLTAEGEINRVGKTILLTSVFRALQINPNAVSDIAVISVALDKCAE